MRTDHLEERLQQVEGLAEQTCKRKRDGADVVTIPVRRLEEGEKRRRLRAGMAAGKQSTFCSRFLAGIAEFQRQ